jgi:Mor family transcriptional regulator
MNMQGYTIQELSKKLKISERAVYQRLRSIGIEPLTRQAIYPEVALEKIREVSKGGRPKNPIGPGKSAIPKNKP